MQKFGKPSPRSLIENPFKHQILVTDVKGQFVDRASYDEESVWQVLEHVQDPEIPTVSVVDLGIVRDVNLSKGLVTVDVTPTYSGCPATDLINELIIEALTTAGFPRVVVNPVLSPAWTTDFITPEGKAKLKAFGIAPPESGISKLSLVERDIPCPHCDSHETKLISEFGSTACKALYQCQTCREAFDYFKCI